MSLSLVKGKSIEEPSQFSTTNLYRGRAALLRPLKRSFLQTAIVEPESIVFPVENFEFVALTIAKDKEERGKWVEVEAFLDQGCQPVDRLA